MCAITCSLQSVTFSRIVFEQIVRDESDVLHYLLPSLAERRSELSRTVFEQIVRDESHVLHYLLPPQRDIQLVRRLLLKRTMLTVYADYALSSLGTPRYT